MRVARSGTALQAPPVPAMVMMVPRAGAGFVLAAPFADDGDPAEGDAEGEPDGAGADERAADGDDVLRAGGGLGVAHLGEEDDRAEREQAAGEDPREGAQVLAAAGERLAFGAEAVAPPPAVADEVLLVRGRRGGVLGQR